MDKAELLSVIMKVHPTGCKLRSFVRECEPKLGRKLPKRRFAEKLYLHLHGGGGSCKQCGKPTKLRSFYKGYAPFCCRGCSVLYREPDTGRPQRRVIAGLNKLFVRRMPLEGLYARARRSVHWGKITSRAEKFGVPPAQIVYHTYVSPHVPACKNCGDPTRFSGLAKGYKTYCCVDCANTAESHRSRSEAARVTWRKRYGFDHPMQDPSIYHRTSRSMKRTKYAEVCGRKFSYQGYELFMIYHLSGKYGSSAIRTGLGSCKPIWYDYGGSRHRYYPDMRVGNVVYEVKSTRTFGLRDEAVFDRVVAKARAARRTGYDFRCAVFGNDGKLLLKSSLRKPYAYYVKRLSRR